MIKNLLVEVDEDFTALELDNLKREISELVGVSSVQPIDYAALALAAREVIEIAKNAGLSGFGYIAAAHMHSEPFRNAMNALAARLQDAPRESTKPKNIKAGDDFSYILGQQVKK